MYFLGQWYILLIRLYFNKKLNVLLQQDSYMRKNPQKPLEFLLMNN